jgi:predicted deacylase
MLPGPVEMVGKPCWIDPSEVLTSPDTGTWHAAVRADQVVRKGEVLGRLTDYFGDLIADITSPMDGLVTFVVVSPAMGKGEPVAMVGRVTNSPAAAPP